MHALRIDEDVSTEQSSERVFKSEGVSSLLRERFSTLYVRSENPTPDSSRARHRISALFREIVFKSHTEHLAHYLVQELGIPVPEQGSHSSDWDQFIRGCSTPQFLDTITLVYRHLFYHSSRQTANRWRDVVKRIFSEENLAYEIDEVGGVHPAIDGEFQRNSASAMAVLQSDRYDHVREFYEQASNRLSSDPPNYLQAWRAMFSAVQALFDLMFPYVRLTAEDIDRRLRPVVKRAYESDAAAQRAALRMIATFQDWVDVSHIYRHRPGAEESAQPPADVAVLAITLGASLLRWLAGLDEDRPADCKGSIAAGFHRADV